MDNRQPQPLIGGLHIHSNYSSDAEWSLQKCKTAFQKEGYHFLGMTEHAEDMDDASLAVWTEACQLLSDSEFLFIPGLEFSLGPEIHILGFGLRRKVSGRSIGELIARIREAGGVAVWAHPLPEAINLIYPHVTELNGMEIWNGRYHGGKSPSLRLLLALEKLREANPMFHGFGGIDFHEGEQERGIAVALRAERTPASILEALRAGRFEIKKGEHSIPADGSLTLKQQLGIALNVPPLWKKSDAIFS
ncbi:MAG TPA: hypothetical protein VFA47_03740 [Candidatus Manganitrophaceae bacterium]|nr:hypothetical protein [Candidatus Manganitrophaceae bacterium]